MSKIVLFLAMFLSYNFIFASYAYLSGDKTNPQSHQINSQINESCLYQSKGNILYILYSYNNHNENFKTLKLVEFDTNKNQKIKEKDFKTEFDLIYKIEYQEINKNYFYAIVHARNMIKLIKCTYDGAFVENDQIDIPLENHSIIQKYFVYENNLYYSLWSKQDRFVKIKEMKYSFTSKKHTQIFENVYFSPNYYSIDSYQIKNNFFYLYGMGRLLIIEKYDIHGNLLIKKQFANNLLHGNKLKSGLIDEQIFLGYTSKNDDPLLRGMIISKDLSLSASDSLLIQKSMDLKKIAIMPDNLKFCFAVISVENDKIYNLLKIPFNKNTSKFSNPVLLTNINSVYDLSIINFNNGIAYKLHSNGQYNYFCNDPLDFYFIPDVFNRTNLKYSNQLIIHQKDNSYLCVFFDNNNLYYNILINELFVFSKHQIVSKINNPSPLINMKSLPPIKM